MVGGDRDYSIAVVGGDRHYSVAVVGGDRDYSIAVMVRNQIRQNDGGGLNLTLGSTTEL